MKLVWFEFETWWNKHPISAYRNIETMDVEAAYVAGFNACRDKWGGMDYDDSLNYERLDNT